MTSTAPPRSTGTARIVRLAAGLLFLWASGVHVGIASADPQLYRDVADAAWVPGIRTAWREIFMAHPRGWGLAVAAGELVIGALLLRGAHTARLGLAMAVGFHIGLMSLGWGFWIWSVPALVALLGPGRQHDRAEASSLETAASHS